MEAAEEPVGVREGGGGGGGGDGDDGDRSDYTPEDEGFTPPTDSFFLASRLHGRRCSRPTSTTLPRLALGYADDRMCSSAAAYGLVPQFVLSSWSWSYLLLNLIVSLFVVIGLV